MDTSGWPGNTVTSITVSSFPPKPAVRPMKLEQAGLQSWPQQVLHRPCCTIGTGAGQLWWAATGANANASDDHLASFFTSGRSPSYIMGLVFWFFAVFGVRFLAFCPVDSWVIKAQTKKWAGRPAECQLDILAGQPGPRSREKWGILQNSNCSFSFVLVLGFIWDLLTMAEDHPNSRSVQTCNKWELECLQIMHMTAFGKLQQNLFHRFPCSHSK